MSIQFKHFEEKERTAGTKIQDLKRFIIILNNLFLLIIYFLDGNDNVDKNKTSQIFNQLNNN